MTNDGDISNRWANTTQAKVPTEKKETTLYGKIDKRGNEVTADSRTRMQKSERVQSVEQQV